MPIGRFAGEKFNILNPFTYGNFGKVVDKTREGDEDKGYNIQQNEPYPDPFGVQLPLAKADEKDMKAKDFLNAYLGMIA